MTTKKPPFSGSQLTTKPLKVSEKSSTPSLSITQSLLSSKMESKKDPKTRVVVRYDVGFNNSLSLRGKGANLCWEKGVPLKNIKNDEWIWETEVHFNTCEFKVLINDEEYEIGENHPISCGASIQYTPQF